MTAWLVIVFALGYVLIAGEHLTGINKAAVALLTAVVCWSVYILWGPDTKPEVVARLIDHLGDVSGILFFVLGAMTIVGLIDAHNGFQIITDRVRQTNKRKLLWTIAGIAFFLSAVLDNLTTTIVGIAFLRKLVADKEDRRLCAGAVIIAANAGGAWSPIGDVTTTMLWMGGQITTKGIILSTGLPSLVCLAVATGLISLRLKGEITRSVAAPRVTVEPISHCHQATVLIAGLLALVSVPVVKTVTHLPPFMGMLAALGAMWVITEVLHRRKNESEPNAYTVAGALRKIDTALILFFLGILLCVAALQSADLLHRLGVWMATHMPDARVTIVSMGLLSAVIDNVPLTAAAQGMYTLAQYPGGHEFWNLFAYCVGTGGSVLIIGSAAGVVAMGMERLDFWWYLRRITWIALCAYLAGVMTFILQLALPIR
jgi:Na+/H+ antiporter NhaD/arsenite permease-like protein